MAMVGEILVLPTATPLPELFAECNGQILPLQRYEPLYSLIGTTFGGQAPQTFALPDLPDPAPGLRYVISLDGEFPQLQT